MRNLTWLFLALVWFSSSTSASAQLRPRTGAALDSQALSEGRPRVQNGVGRSIRDPDKDSLWNGILIGAAIGILANLTTAAEAPPSGKVMVVITAAATGGWVDSRFEITARPGWLNGRHRSALGLGYRIRF